MSPAESGRIRGISDVHRAHLSRDQPVTMFTAKDDLKAFRLDAFVNPLVHTFWDNQCTPSIMTMSAALAE